MKNAITSSDKIQKEERRTWERLEKEYEKAIEEEEKKVNQMHGVLEELRGEILEKVKLLHTAQQELGDLREMSEEMKKENEGLRSRVGSVRTVVAGEGGSADDKRLALLLDLQNKYEGSQKEVTKVLVFFFFFFNIYI